MCEINMEASHTEGGVNLEITCAKTGKRLTSTNDYGMFCEDMCDFEETKKTYDSIFADIMDDDSP